VKVVFTPYMIKEDVKMNNYKKTYSETIRFMIKLPQFWLGVGCFTIIGIMFFFEVQI